MKIHDALVLELIKPDIYGEPTGKIINIVGDKKIRYECEYTERIQERAARSLETLVDYLTPDILITRLRSEVGHTRKAVIELETDEGFDYAASMRQIKKYRKMWEDVRIIIPWEFRDFAPLYYYEKFPVWIWKAKRKYECLRCQTITVIENRYEVKCEKCKKFTKHNLLGIEDVEFNEYSPESL